MSENTDIIYFFGFNERASRNLERLLPILKSQKNRGTKIGIVLIHDGVINASSRGKIPDPVKELLSLDILMYTMVPDLKARGIATDNIHGSITPIEYSDLVDLMESSKKLISWM